MVLWCSSICGTRRLSQAIHFRKMQVKTTNATSDILPLSISYSLNNCIVYEPNTVRFNLVQKCTRGLRRTASNDSCNILSDYTQEMPQPQSRSIALQRHQKKESLVKWNMDNSFKSTYMKNHNEIHIIQTTVIEQSKGLNGITKTRLFKYIDKFTTKNGKLLDKKNLIFFIFLLKT